MAETRWENTGPDGIPRAEVRTPSVGLDGARYVERSDPTSYSPLSNPDAPSEHGISPPVVTPPPATEADLRDVLEQCITAKAFAADNLQRATEVAARGVAHREACELRLRDFHDLDERITAATIEGLRDGHGRPMHDDSPFRRLVIERGIARDDLAAATRAEAVLSQALDDAKVEADAATRAADRAAVALSMLLAERVAERVLAHEAEAQRLREILFGSDVVGTPTPAIVRKLFGDGSRYLRPVDRTAWQALRQRLLDDPGTKLELEGV